jgi:hypothetical protein
MMSGVDPKRANVSSEAHHRCWPGYTIYALTCLRSRHQERALTPDNWQKNIKRLSVYYVMTMDTKMEAFLAIYESIFVSMKRLNYFELTACFPVTIVWNQIWTGRVPVLVQNFKWPFNRSNSTMWRLDDLRDYGISDFFLFTQLKEVPHPHLKRCRIQYGPISR